MIVEPQRCARSITTRLRHAGKSDRSRGTLRPRDDRGCVLRPRGHERLSNDSRVTFELSVGQRISTGGPSAMGRPALIPRHLASPPRRSECRLDLSRPSIRRGARPGSRKHQFKLIPSLLTPLHAHPKLHAQFCAMSRSCGFVGIIADAARAISDRFPAEFRSLSTAKGRPCTVWRAGITVRPFSVCHYRPFQSRGRLQHASRNATICRFRVFVWLLAPVVQLSSRP